MEDYVKIHTSGNPAYSMDNFMDNPEFSATPAFFASEESWNKFFKLMSPNQWKTYDYKLEEILGGSKHFQDRFHSGQVGVLPKEGYSSITIPDFLLMKLKIKARNYKSIAAYMNQLIK